MADQPQDPPAPPPGDPGAGAPPAGGADAKKRTLIAGRLGASAIPRPAAVPRPAAAPPNPPPQKTPVMGADPPARSHSGTMAFRAPTQPNAAPPEQPPPATAGGSHAPVTAPSPTRRTALGGTMAFGAPTQDQIDEARKAAAQQPPPGPIKRNTPMPGQAVQSPSGPPRQSGAPHQSGAPRQSEAPAPGRRARRAELSSTVAFGEVPPEVVAAQQQAGVIMSGPTQAPAPKADFSRTVAFGESPAPVEDAQAALERATKQAIAEATARARAAGPSPPVQGGRNKPKWGGTMAFGEVPANLDDYAPQAQQAQQPQPQPSAQAAPITQPQPTAPRQGRGGLNATLAFESPLDAGVPTRPDRAPAAKAADLNSTMAFAPEFEDPPAATPPMPGPVTAPAAPHRRGADFGSTVAFEAPPQVQAAQVQAQQPQQSAPPPALADAAANLFESATAASKRATFGKQGVASKKRTMLGGLQAARLEAAEAARELEQMHSGQPPAPPAPALIQTVPSAIGPAPQVPTPQVPGPLANLPASSLASTVASAVDPEPVATPAPFTVEEVVVEEASWSEVFPPSAQQPPPPPAPQGAPAFTPQSYAAIPEAPPAPGDSGAYGAMPYAPVHAGTHTPGPPSAGYQPPSAAASMPLPLQPAQTPPMAPFPPAAPLAPPAAFAVVAPAKNRTPLLVAVAVGSILFGVLVVLLLWKLSG
jgi:hypothetical protein